MQCFCVGLRDDLIQGLTIWVKASATDFANYALRVSRTRAGVALLMQSNEDSVTHFFFRARS
jgi:hypothetical protein